MAAGWPWDAVECQALTVAAGTRDRHEGGLPSPLIYFLPWWLCDWADVPKFPNGTSFFSKKVEEVLEESTLAFLDFSFSSVYGDNHGTQSQGCSED